MSAPDGRQKMLPHVRLQLMAASDEQVFIQENMVRAGMIYGTFE